MDKGFISNLNVDFYLQVEFYVGEVVEVISANSWGVVGGWDLVAKVPDDWLTTVYGGNADRMWQPHFLVFLDLRQIDVDQFEMVYVGQVHFGFVFEFDF